MAHGELAERLRGGDESALAEAYRLFAPLVFSLAHRSLRHREDAEDVTQQVFVAAWRGRHNLRLGDDSLPAWLVGITRHRIADAHEERTRVSRRVAAATVIPITTSTPTPEEEVVSSVVVAHALAGLGEPRQTIVRMAVIDGRTHPEIAEELGLPMGTVKSHARRGLLALRDTLKEVAHAS